LTPEPLIVMGIYTHSVIDLGVFKHISNSMVIGEYLHLNSEKSTR